MYRIPDNNLRRLMDPMFAIVLIDPGEIGKSCYNTAAQPRKPSGLRIFDTYSVVLRSRGSR